MAHAPERRRRRAEAAGGGRRARQRPRLRQPHAAPRRCAPRVARRRRVPHRQRRRRQRPGSLAEHGEARRAPRPSLSRRLRALEMEACCVGVDWIWGRAAAWALFGMVYRNDPDWGFGLSYFWIFVRIGFGLFCDESMVSERKRSATVLSLQYAAFDSIGFWGSLWVGLELACLTNFEAYAVD